MAMFLARIKKALNLGTKSITANGTYTASSDGYDGYSQVSVTVPDPPSITPSNASPVALTANSSVKPSANGYAIASYNNVTPSNNAQSVGENDIVRFASTGKIVKDVIEETPSSLSPTYLSRNNIYKIINNSGHLINEYFSKTPSDTNPPSVALMDIIQITGNSGYLYKTQQASATVKHYTTNVTFSDNTTYQYIATGKFLGFELNRTSVAAAPSVQVYIKVGNTYTAVSRVVATLNGTICGAISTESTPTQGDIYMKKTTGSTFTTTSLNVEYL